MKNMLLAFALVCLTACAGTSEQTGAARGERRAVSGAWRQRRDHAGRRFVFPALNADARINTLFAKVDHNDLRRLVIEQMCEATGGPCKYTGRSMEEAHSGLNLTNKDFDAFVEDLVTAMNEAKVAKPTQKKLLAILGPMRPQVVGQ